MLLPRVSSFTGDRKLVLELDDQAQIISYEEYYPYGSTSYQAVRSKTETPKRYRYTGKERDEESGLYYHGARYYACWLGRWTACDPAGMIDGINCYVVMRVNPLRFSDPDGHKSNDTISFTINVGDRDIRLEGLRRGVDPTDPGIYRDIQRQLSDEATVNLMQRTAKPGMIYDFARSERGAARYFLSKFQDTSSIPYDAKHAYGFVLGTSGQLQDIAAYIVPKGNADIFEDREGKYLGDYRTIGLQAPLIDPIDIISGIAAERLILGATAGRFISQAASKPLKQVLLDTSAVYPFLGGQVSLAEQEVPVISRAVLRELENNATRKGLKLPKLLKNFTVIEDSGNAEMRLALRQAEIDPKIASNAKLEFWNVEKNTVLSKNKGIKGMWGDAIIAETARSRGMPLITFDKGQSEALKGLGGIVRFLEFAH